MVLILSRQEEIIFVKRLLGSYLINNDKLFEILPKNEPINYNFRQKRNLSLVKCRTERFKKSYIPFAIQHYFKYFIVHSIILKSL